MANTILIDRLFSFARATDYQKILELEEVETVEDFVRFLERDTEAFELLVADYKLEKWAHWRVRTAGAEPCTSLAGLQRASRRIDEKMLVLAGWFDEAGGLRGYCAYCAIPLDIHEVTVDHVVPRSTGGGLELANCVPACHDCNREKSDRSAREYLVSKGLAAEEATALEESWARRRRWRDESAAIWTCRLSERQRQRLNVIDRTRPPATSSVCH